MGMKRQTSWGWALGTIAYGVWCAIATATDFVPSDRLPRPRRTIVARVTRAVSGQTIEVDLNGKIETVRLLGIDAPDLRQTPWGQASQQSLAREVEGREVTLSWPNAEANESVLPPRDRFDRLWAHVWIDDRLVAADLVRAGWALTGDRAGPYAADLAAARAEARQLDRGIWNPDRAMRRDPRALRSER